MYEFSVEKPLIPTFHSSIIWLFLKWDEPQYKGVQPSFTVSWLAFIEGNTLDHAYFRSVRSHFGLFIVFEIGFSVAGVEGFGVQHFWVLGWGCFVLKCICTACCRSLVQTTLRSIFFQYLRLGRRCLFLNCLYKTLIE